MSNRRPRMKHSRTRIAERQVQAKARQAERSKRSTSDQLALLATRPGEALKERTRLEHQSDKPERKVRKGTESNDSVQHDRSARSRD